MSNVMENEMHSTPPEFKHIPEKSLQDLIPKSRKVYDFAYKRFLNWAKQHKASLYSENVLLAYFNHLSNNENLKSSTLWSQYSMLKAELKINHSIQLADYTELTAFLKRKNCGYKPKKSKILSKEQVDNFLHNAPNEKYLATKVILILGMCGACRCDEITNLTMGDIKDLGSAILVKVEETNNYKSRSFTILGKFYLDICRKYISVRKDIDIPRFMLKYHNGKCANMVMGKHKIGSAPREIASFLELPDCNEYTGHCLSRTSATLLMDNGGDISAPKKHGVWHSTAVAKSNIEDSMENKNQTTVKILAPLDINRLSTSATGSSAAEENCDENLNTADSLSADPNSHLRESATGSSAAEENCEKNLNTADSLSDADPNSHLRESVTEGSSIAGNRVTNLLYIFSQLRTISAHRNKLGCTFQNLVIEKEVRRGLFSKLFLRCEMCNETFKIENVDSNSSNAPDINDAALKGIKSIGRELDDLEIFLGNLDIPYKSLNRTHEKQHNVNDVGRQEVSVKVAKVMKTKMSRVSNEENYSCQKKAKMNEDTSEDTNTNLSSELEVKQESPVEDCNNEATIKEEEICIKDEIIEEELQPSTSFSSKNEATTEDVTVKTEVSEDITVKTEVSEPSFNHVFQFKITLHRNCWRRIQVPDYYTFHDLHLAIQKSMGWESVLYDYHLHKFEVTNPSTGLEDGILMPDDVPYYKDLMDGDVKSEVTTKIVHYFKSPGHRARYEYDFGMGWDHEVLLENILARKEGERYPKCVAWKGECPPEDGVAHSDEEKEDFDPLHCFET